MLKRKSELARKDFLNSINNSKENVIIAPERGSFRGATNKLGRVKCNGIIALTDKKIYFLKAFGGNFKIELKEIETVTTDSKFLGAWRASATHLIINLINGSKIGFFVADIKRWETALINAVSNRQNKKY